MEFKRNITAIEFSTDWFTFMMSIKNLKIFIIEYLDGNRWLRKLVLFTYRLLKFSRYFIGKTPPRYKGCVAEGEFRSVGPNTFFGYFDISPSFGDQALFHKLVGDQSVEIMSCDLSTGATSKLGQTSCWSYQQGAMTQWLQGRVVFNASKGDELGAFLQNGDDWEFHAYPVELACSDGWFSINFKRLTHSEYGYAVPEHPSNFQVDQPTDRDGIWLYNPASRNAELVVRLSDLKHDDNTIKTEFINHLSLSRDERYLLFIHRTIGRGGRNSRLYLFDRQSSDVKLILDEGFASHYCWISDRQFVIYARYNGRKGYFCYDTESGAFASFMNGMLDKYGDGHPTASPDGKYLLTDTYADDEGYRNLLLIDLATATCTTIARFWVPFAFFDDKRCDLHPRWSRCGQYIFVDSAHSGRREFYSVSTRTVLHHDQ